MMNDIVEEWEVLEERLFKKTWKRSPKGMKPRPDMDDLENLTESVKLDELPGMLADIYKVGNKLLNIPKEKMLYHPCVVVESSDSSEIALSKGTDASRVAERYLHHYVIMERDKENGLKKRTAFETSIRRIRFRFLFKSDRLGRLSEEDFARLKNRIRMP